MAAGKSTTFDNDILALIFNATAITSLARDAASPLTSLYFTLSTGTLSAASTQATTEAAYTGYTGVVRPAVARTTGGFPAPSGGSISPAANISFPAATGGSETETYASVGTGDTVGATGKVLYWGTVTPNIVVSNGVTPVLTTASTITEA